MMFSDMIRFFFACLTAWYPNKRLDDNKDFLIRKSILSKIDKQKIKKKDLKKTHQYFNKEILKLLLSQNLQNFLRKNFIQKMFFLHNRLFVYSELKELKNSKEWNKYNKLLIEDNVGNPIRYFLYFNSSGNRINHVYHLYLLEKELNINLKKDIINILEFGGGYGCMARIFSKINTNIRFQCFDTEYVNLLQYYYLKHNNLDVGFSKKYPFFLTSKISKLKKKYDLFIANWSLSETPIHFRKKFLTQINNSKYIFISFQEVFEDIDNIKYFTNLKKILSKKYHINIIKNKFYKGNFLKKQNHYFFIGKKIQ